MQTAGRDGAKSPLLISSSKSLFVTLKSHSSPWQHDDPPLTNPFVNTTLSTRLIAAFLLRHAGTSCTLTFRPGTEQLFILPICSAPHGNGIEEAHAHGWLPWPIETNARVHPLELTAFQPGHAHNDLWKSLQHFQTQDEQHPLFLCSTHSVDEKANRVSPDITQACFAQTPWSTISPTRKIWTHFGPRVPTVSTPSHATATPDPHHDQSQQGGSSSTHTGHHQTQQRAIGSRSAPQQTTKKRQDTPPKRTWKARKTDKDTQTISTSLYITTFTVIAHLRDRIVALISTFALRAGLIMGQQRPATL